MRSFCKHVHIIQRSCPQPLPQLRVQLTPAQLTNLSSAFFLFPRVFGSLMKLHRVERSKQINSTFSKSKMAKNPDEGKKKKCKRTSTLIKPRIDFQIAELLNLVFCTTKTWILYVPLFRYEKG